MSLPQVLHHMTSPTLAMRESMSPNEIVNPYKKPNKKRPKPTVRIRTLPQYFPPKHRLRTILRKRLDTEQGNTTESTILGTTKDDLIDRQLLLSFEKEENHHWGDSILVKAENTTRIYFQNINGLRAGNTKSVKWPSVVKSMSDAHIDLAGFAETNVNWSKSIIKKNMTKTLRQQCDHAVITTSRNQIQSTLTSKQGTISPSSYLPGGTMFCSTSHWTGRVTSHISDESSMGRWSGQKFRLKKDHYAYIISAYRPVKKSRSDETKGNQTVFRQQHTLLRRMGEETPNPRQRFIEDLIVLINKWNEEPNVSIILMLDANETLNEEKKGISRLMKATGLIDAFPRHHKHSCNIATNIKAQGVRRIDFILTSSNILPYIKRCGYLSFYHGFDSDHRGLFLDLSNNWIDGAVPLGIQTIRSIGTSSNKKDILLYKEYIMSHFTDHNILARAEKLYQNATPTMHNDPNFLKELNSLDKQVVEIALAAEKSICTRRPNTEWSPPLHQASLIIRYWITRLKGKRNNISVDVQLDYLKSQMNECSQNTIASNTSSIITALRNAKSAKVDLMIQHKELRARYLQERIHADSVYENTCSETIAAKISHKETCAQIFVELHDIFHNGERSGISHIMVPENDKDGNPTDDPNKAATWTNITAPTEIETTLLSYSIRQFGQGQGTAFTIDPLLSELGYDGTSTSATKITEGTIPFPVTNLSAGSIHLLKRIANNAQLPAIDDDITEAEFWKGMRKWSEKTSTSPFRHLGHFKVLQCADGNDINYTIDVPNLSTNIMKIYFLIAMSALRSGNTLDRWCNATTAMLEKIPGTPKINKLRVIHLYEPDYNMLLKLLWARKLVWNAHSNTRLNDGQAGSRPGRRAVDIVIQKEMKYLYARLTRTNLASMDNDAKSCYDRIICNLAMMVSKYFGMTSRACQLQASTLRKMQFRLRTALGESQRHYSHSESTPVHGSGQGSCASPCLWLLISSLLIDCLEELGGGMTMEDVQNLQVIRQWLDGYVDDTSLFANLIGTNQNDIKVLSSQLQSDMLSWATLLEASGGQLELSKCFYYILSWKFEEEGDATPLSLSEIESIASPIQIFDKLTNQTVNIDQKDVSEAHKTLGVWKSMTGNESKQILELTKKSHKYAAIVRCSNLTRRQARIAYSSIYMPAMTYSLAATNISGDALTKIQSQAVEAFLPAMGYDHSFPRSVVYGPRTFGGLNLGHLQTEQCTSKIQTMITHLRAHSTLGKIMRLNLVWTQLYSGKGTPILESHDELTYITNNWFIIHIRDFLITIKGSIHIPDIWRPTIERKGDKILMDEFSNLSLLPARLRLVNNWRLYFQVLTLSDITNATGTAVLSLYRKRPLGTTRAYPRSTKLRWPQQEEPGAYGFRQWMLCLKNCFGMRSDGTIQNPLGEWYTDVHQSNSTWQSYMNIESKELYISSPGEVWVHTPVYQRSHTCRYSKSIRQLCHSIPIGAIPVDPEYTPSGMRLDHKSIGMSSSRDITPPEINSFQDYVSQSPSWSNDLLQNWESTDIALSIDSLSEVKNEIIMVSDGGLCHNRGSFGVIIGTATTDLITNQGIAHCTPELHSSFRAEAYGMLSGCHLLSSIITYYDIAVPATKPFIIYSDNMGLVTRVSKHIHNAIPLKGYDAPDIDVELQILQEIKTLQRYGFELSIRHVKGHQDSTTPVSNLSREAQMNVMADALATNAYSSKDKSNYFPFPANPILLRINHNCITSKTRQSLHTSHLSQSLRKYMRTKFGWSPHLPSQVWWSIHGKSIASLSHNDRMRIQKFIFNRMATNKRESLYHSHISSACSTCHHTVEDEDHVIKCLSPSRDNLRNEWLSAFERFLNEPHTHHVVRSALLLGLTAWLNNSPPPKIMDHIHNASPTLIQAYNEQSTIGWNHFVRGRLSIKWSYLAQHHLDLNNFSATSMTAERWGRRIISLNWIGVLSLWECRCIELHGDTPESQKENTIKKLLTEAISIQNTNLPISYIDREMLFRPIRDLEKYSVLSLQAWIRNSRYIIQTYRIEARKENLSLSRKHTRFRDHRDDDADEGIT